MRRLLAVGVAGIAALLAVSVVVIVIATRGPAQAIAPTPLAQLASRAGTPPAAGAPVDMAKMPLGGIPLPPPPAAADERPPPPPAGSWEAVPIAAARRGALGIDLEEIQPRLARCFHPDVEARFGATPIVQVKDSAPLQDDATTALVLQIEVSGDRLLVVDAPVESRGPASDGTLACAQAVLRGQTAPAAGLSNGKHRVRFALSP